LARSHTEVVHVGSARSSVWKRRVPLLGGVRGGFYGGKTKDKSNTTKVQS
jgi:hypothetical protein